MGEIININLDFDNPFIIKKKDASIYVKMFKFSPKLSFNKKSEINNCAIIKTYYQKNFWVTEFLAKNVTSE